MFSLILTKVMIKFSIFDIIQVLLLSHKFLNVFLYSGLLSNIKILSFSVCYVNKLLIHSPEIYCFYNSCTFLRFLFIILHLLNRITKQNRAAGVLDNFAEGEKYAEHSLRKFVRNRKPEIMPNLNSFFTDPQRN